MSPNARVLLFVIKLAKMKAFFFAFIVCHLVVTKSMAASAHGRSKNKGNKVDDALGLGVNDTGSDQHFENGIRRTLVDADDLCYIKYFVGQRPPEGFRPASNLIKHICQTIFDDKPDEARYATMFDQKIGIPVFVGYLVKKEQVDLIGTFPRISKWFQDPDIALQGSDKKYRGNTQNIQKGHLVPASTYSFDCVSMVSTFTYTNAVPQYQLFNTGPWSTYEGEVRKKAGQCANLNGDLYLLTGISEVEVDQYGKGMKADMKYFPVDNKDIGENIAIPNSMWTAGCCIRRQDSNALGGFAAIGNNVQVGSAMHEVKVKQLQEILAKGTGGAINLFPGNDGCYK